MAEKRDLFYFLNNLFNKRYAYPEDKEIANVGWMLNRFLSMEKDLVIYIAEVSKYLYTLGGVRYYRLLYRLIPQSSTPRNKYVKPKVEFAEELMDRYVQYFGLGINEVTAYLRILRKRYSDKELYNFVGLELKASNAKA